MLILQMRQAETALKAGRLDEAFELCESEQVRAHRRGQKLLTRLTKRLLERGQQHLDAGRIQEAATDCKKAKDVAGNLTEIGDLQSAIKTQLETLQRDVDKARQLRATAEKQIQQGRLSLGEQLLEDTSDSKFDDVRQDCRIRRAAGESAIQQAERAIESQAWSDAIDALNEVRRAGNENDRFRQNVSRLAEMVEELSHDAIRQGQLDLAEAMLDRFATLAADHVKMIAARRFLHQCRKAATLIRTRSIEEAAEVLNRLGQLEPDIGWLNDAREHAQQAAAHYRELRGNILGFAMTDSFRLPAETGPAEDQKTQPLPAPHREVAKPVDRDQAEIPQRFILQADGIGAFMIVRKPHVRIGPNRTSSSIDVELAIDSRLPVVELHRQDEDYFVSAEQEIQINHQKTKSKLLVDQDRISIGPRCRLKFNRPHAASPSAVLSLSGGRLQYSDARRIILMEGSIVIGPGKTSHIRADQLQQPMVLFVRNNSLQIQPQSGMAAGEPALNKPVTIELGQATRIGDINMVVTPIKEA